MQYINDYSIIQVSGLDSLSFLNNFSTNLIIQKEQSITYSCVLTPNGRFMYDFLLIQNTINYIAINRNFADGFIKYLSMYKIALDLVFKKTDLQLGWSLDDGEFQDPRNCALGFYNIIQNNNIDVSQEFHVNRIKLNIADGFYDLVQKESIILDYGFDDLSAICYTKGCYLGQELISRTHHTGVIRKKIYHFYSIQNFDKGVKVYQNEEQIGQVLGKIDNNYLAQIKFENANFSQKFMIQDREINII